LSGLFLTASFIASFTSLSDRPLTFISFILLLLLIHDFIISFKINPLLNHSLVVLTKKNENDLTGKYEKLGINIKYFNFDNRLFNFGSIPKNIVQIIGEWQRKKPMDAFLKQEITET